jgi:hypothetical protein
VGIEHDQKAVAVGCSGRRECSARDAIAAAAIVDNDLLAEDSRQAFGDDARDLIGRAADRKRLDETHGLGRPLHVLRRCELRA